MCRTIHYVHLLLQISINSVNSHSLDNTSVLICMGSSGDQYGGYLERGHLSLRIMDTEFHTGSCSYVAHDLRL